MELPDTQEPRESVVLLAVKKNPSPAIEIIESDDAEDPPEPHEHTHILAQLNERLRKTLSLDSRRTHSVQPQSERPKSMVHNSCCTSPCVGRTKNVKPEQTKTNKKKKFRPKSFFSLETFLDSRRSDTSSRDDYSSSKYCKFYLDTPESSPLFHGRNTPDLLDTPGISTAGVVESSCKIRLDKLENHFNKTQKLRSAQVRGENERNNENGEDIVVGIYSEPIYSSQSTLIVGGGRRSADEDTKTNNICDRREASYNCLDYCGIGFREHLEDLKPVTDSDLRRIDDWNNRRPERNASEESNFEIVIKKNDVLINDRTRDLTVKTMDKSVDSIGSCSLDVDADNTDFSDTTSGSLNILTPSSTTSHFKEFTSRLQERAGLGLQRQDLKTLNEEIHDHYLLVPSPPRKKPSYLHLACSVNGYSNITTYDSKLRQKFNKSREASPGRFGDTADMLRECTDDMMTTRLNTTNTNNYFKASFSETSITSNKMTYSKSNGVNNAGETRASKSYTVISNGTNDSSPSKSFIQQRVERLYGPGALAQGFFNQKRQKTKSQIDEEQKLNGEKLLINSLKSPETLHQMSSVQTLKRTLNGTVTERIMTESYTNGQNTQEPPLPVLRHLTPEFRAQLPILSPKRNLPSKDFNSSDSDNLLNSPLSRLSGDVVDRGLPRYDVKVVSPLAKDATVKSPLVTVVPIKLEADLETNIKKQNGHANLNEKLDKLEVSAPRQTIDLDTVVSVVPVIIVKESLDDNCNPVCAEVLVDSSNIPQDIVKSQDLVVDLTKSGDAGVSDNVCSVVVQDAHYFLDLKRKETERLIKLAEAAESDLEELQARGGVNEEVLGFLRAAAGKARLLATQKMQQFEGLCFNNLNCGVDEPYPTTCQDLSGFWDMVSLQLVHIAQLFEQLQTMKVNGWKEVPPSVKMTDLAPSRPAAKSSQKTTVKKTPTTSPADAAKAAAAAKKREEQRKALMLARRNKMNALKEEKNSSVEIYVPQSKSEAEQVSSSKS